MRYAFRIVWQLASVGVRHSLVKPAKARRLVKFRPAAVCQLMYVRTPAYAFLGKDFNKPLTAPGAR